MKLGIVGSRGIDRVIAKEIITQVVNRAYNSMDTIVSGGASGVDTWAGEYATEEGLELIIFLPNYREFGRYAPLKRNLQIINASDFILAIWDGKSRGTKHTIDQARKIGKVVMVVTV